MAEREGSDTTIESDIESDFDVMEEIDPSYEIDSSLWTKVRDLDEVELKPAAPPLPEGATAPPPEKKKKEVEVEEEEDSGFSELVIRSEKDRDLEFQEYIRELCRPQIVSYLPDRVAAKGTDVRLTCTVEGNNVQTKWMKDDIPLERKKNVQFKSDGEIHILEITAITEKDAGVYTASFKNRAGEVETSSRIKVFDGKLHKPDHIDIALVKDYYDHSLGGLVIEAHVHGLPTPNVKFYRDGHLLHARKQKIVFFCENKEIFQCLLVRPDASVSGRYTILAENAAGKKRFDHDVDFVTKYPFMNLPMIRHADKKLEDFVEEMLEKVPKQPEQPAQPEAAPAEQVAEVPAEASKAPEEEAKPEVQQPPKAEEIAEALQAVADSGEKRTDGEAAPVEEKPKKHKSKSRHRKKKASSPKIDADLINDGEDEPETDVPDVLELVTDAKRKFSTVVHEPYETESFRIYNAKNNCWFSGKLHDQTVIEGSNMKLLCTVSGPLPIMKWLKNGKPVPWSATVRNLTAEGLGQVIIEKIQKSDAGVYTCSAKNQFNEVTTSATIKVIPRSVVPRTDETKPHFTRVLAESYRNVEDDLILEAHVRAVPEPKITWFKDGIEITIATDKRFDFTTDHDGGYQLRIHKPKSEDSGLYACEAINSVGKAKITHKVNFTEHERHTHPQFVYHKESFWQPSLRMSIEPEPVKEPEPEFIRAATQPRVAEAQVPPSGSADNQAQPTDGGAGDGEAPAGESGSGGDGNEDGEEGKDGSKLPEDGEEVTDGEAQPEAEGEVQKRPERKPKSRRRRYEGPVEPLLIRDSTKRISFAVTLRDITAPAGSNIKLCCQLVGPGPQVKWLKNEKPLDQSPKLRIPKKDGWGVVTIDKAQSSDSGIYRCCASNSFNVIYTEAKVTIFDVEEVCVKPTFTRISDYYHQDVDDLILEVQVRGTPTPTISWSRDGVVLEVENSEKFFVMREPEGVYKLCIHDPQKIDGGRFIIEASNKAGKEEIRRTIRFLGKDHYKYLPGIYHADPKKPHEREEDDGLAPIIEEVAPAAPESDEPEMDKWGNIKPKKEKKIRLREKVFMPPSAEELERESLVLQQVRNHLEFESELKNQLVKVGSKVKLLCTVSGPKPTLTWFKDDEPFEFDPPKIKNTSSGTFGSITFLSVGEKDAGVYKCVATNAFCEASSECTMTIMPVQDPNWIKPQFTRLLKEYYDQKTNDLILEVHVRGYPRPKLVWNKDGLDVEEGDDKFFTTRHPDGVYRLNIHDPLIRDSGRYGCTATNEAGNEDLKYYLKVKRKEEYIHTAGLYHADPTQFAKYKEEEERKRQERLAYRPPPRPKPEEVPVEAPKEEKPESDIEISDEEAEESEYEGEIEYDEDGEELPRKKKEKPVKPKEPTPPPKEPTPPPKEPTPPPQPVVEEVKEEAAPKKERNWLQGAPEGLPEPVVEKPKRSKYHLEFLTKLENRTGVENTGVKLFCQITGPNPQVSWLFNGTPVAYSDNVKNVSNENVAALTFFKASPEHSGEYTCVVKNRECKIDATCTLNVLEVPKAPEKGIAPHYPFGIKHYFISQTDELIIEVVIRGTPRLFIKWYKDAKQIENDDKYLMSRDGETYKLYVHKPTFRDSGIYLVQVENTYGMEFLKYVIEFERKDEPIVSGFIYHADLTKTKKYQDQEEKKRKERMAYRPPPRPKPEEAAPVEAPASVEEEIIEEEEDETEYETTDSEYDEEGEKIEKERRKKEKGPSKAELRRIQLAEEKARREAEEARLRAEREEQERKIREEEERKAREEAEKKAREEAEKKAQEEAERLAAEAEEKAAAEAAAALEASGKKEIEKPLHVFRAHRIVEFRKNAEVPLEIVKRLLSSYVKVKSKLKLSCCVSEGDPRIKAFWYKNGEPLEIDTRFNANATEDGLITLEFKEIALEDAGRYKVVIKTKKGEISSECDVGVYGEEEKRVEDVPPTMLKAISDWYRPIYNDIIIEIFFRGSPKPTVEWTFSKDGLPINPWKQYDKYQVKHDEVNGHYTQQLIIANPNQYRDNGKYIIRLENRAGIIILDHILSFEGKKIEPKRKRMDEIFIVNEVPRVMPKPKSPTPPPVVEEVKPEEEVKEEEEEVEEEVEEEEEEEEQEE